MGTDLPDLQPQRWGPSLPVRGRANPLRLLTFSALVYPSDKFSQQQQQQLSLFLSHAWIGPCHTALLSLLAKPPLYLGWKKWSSLEFHGSSQQIVPAWCSCHEQDSVAVIVNIHLPERKKEQGGLTASKAPTFTPFSFPLLGSLGENVFSGSCKEKMGM